jgi:hypothetical protein
MARRLLARALAPRVVSAALLAQTPKPQFSVEIEYVEVEARVFGDDGQPIRGLTRGSFHVMEDGVAQTVTAFSEIDLPLPPAPAANSQQARRPAEIPRRRRSP